MPKGKPLIFAVNHQNAFMDGALVALMLKNPMLFLTRSDVFKGKWVVRIFKTLNLVPIFRLQDGVKDIVGKNKMTFKYCIEELEHGKQVLIFPEGISEPIHHLFDLKKGIARLAFEAESKNKFKLSLCIIPVAVNYENHFIGGKKVYVNYGEAIRVSDYQKLFHESPSRARMHLLKDIKSHLKKNMIHIQGDYAKFKQTHWKDIVQKSKNDKQMMEAVQSFPLQDSKFTKEGLLWRNEKYGYNNERSPTSRLFYFLICLPGFFIFAPTILITKLLVKKVKDESFYLSITSFSWLFFGTIQSVISLFYVWKHKGFFVFFSALFFSVLIAGITLRNFNKLVKIGSLFFR
jgi:1-acyl-sn-glycerol-3-phosphate acyltransferase